MVDYLQSGKMSYHRGLAEHQQNMGLRRGDGPALVSPANMSMHSTTSSRSQTNHLLEAEFDMELTYITERTIALCFPDDGSEVTYRQNAKEVSDMLRSKHDTKYAIVNLSGVSRILDKNNPQVYECGFPSQLAPALEALCNICRVVDMWLQTSRDHIIVFHCKGGIDRLACVLAAYINYSSIYDGQSEALNRFAMKQFFDEQLVKWLQPSQARYVKYFTQLLTGNISIRSDPVFLQHIMLHGVPQSADGGSTQVFAKVYANLKPVHTSHILKVTAGQSRVCISLSKPLQLCGDIMIKLFTKRPSGSRHAICRAQLNTSTLSAERISLGKAELDVASVDPTFSSDGKLELIFNRTDSHSQSFEDFSHDSPRSATLASWNSYTDFNTISDDSPLDSPSGTRKSVRVSRYFEDGPLEDSLYNKATPMTSYSTMPVQANGNMYSSSVPGHEYGITNVSSHGRVNITVIPPIKMGRQLSPAAFHTSPSDTQSSSAYSTQQQRMYSSGSSPRSPPITSATYNGNNSNNVNTRTTHSQRTVQSTASYDPPANRGGQLQEPSKATSPHVPTGKEQNDLDEILRELLGESQTSTRTTSTTTNQHVVSGGDDSFVRERQQYTNPDGSTTTIEKRKYKAPNVTENVTINKTSSRKVHTPQQNGAAPDVGSSGVSWLQQQQMKLNQRQQSRDEADSAHRHEVVRELKTVQDRRAFSSSDSEQSDGQTYYSQKDIIVNQQPIAYTVLIKPEEEKMRQEEVRQQNETNLSKKSVTNVSHTHHTHYNFKDAEDSTDQRNKIRELENELRNVKLGLQEKKVESKPPRPPKQQEMEEEEVLSFKPVGIASLESGTGATLPRVIPGPAPASASFEEEETLSFRPVGVNTLESGSGQPFVNTNTMRSGSEGRVLGGGMQNGIGGGVGGGMGGSIGGGTGGGIGGGTGGGMGGSNYYTGTMRSQPQSQYGMSASAGPQRMVTERHTQQSYSQGGQQMAGSPMMGYNQGAHDDSGMAVGAHQGTMGTSGGSQKYGYTTSHSYNSGLSQADHSGTLPHDQTLHVNTGQGHLAAGQHGHVQFTNGQSGEHSEMFGHENSHVTAKFVKDTSKYWYKPAISRDEVINQLKGTVPGTFIVRDSNSFPGAFGLAVRVGQLPANVQVKPGNDIAAEHVRFYLIEPTAKGVKLKGCSNEPVFASLAALIYQHTITPLALPCRLLLPDPDRPTSFNVVAADQVDGVMSSSAINGDITGSANELLKHGAACNVVYLNNVDTESLTGPQAVSRAVQQTFTKGSLDTTVATFKVSNDGITVTDTNHRLFFRQHFPRESVSFCGVDPADRRFTQSLDNGMMIKEAKMFGFVAKKKKGGNHCLLFAELDPEQPASAVVNFVTKVMMNK